MISAELASLRQVLEITCSDDSFANCSSLRNFEVDSGNTVYSSPDGLLVKNTDSKLAIFPCGKGNSYTLPNTIKYIDTNAFAFCVNLESITFNEDLLGIGNFAFRGCTGLKSVTLSSKVSNVGSGVFYQCSNLKRINVDASNTYFMSDGGVLLDKYQHTIS